MNSCFKTNSNIHHNIYYSYISEFRFCYNIVFFIILPFYIICSTIFHGQKKDKFTNIINTNSQICQSRHLLFHLQIPKHHQLLNWQQHLSLLLETKKNYVLYSQNTIQNDASITNNDDTQSRETKKKQNYSIPTISTPNYH